MIQRTRRRLLAAVAGCTALAAGAVVGPTSASAIAPGVLSAGASPIWQTNGPVDALTYYNGVLYVGGEFTSVRPPGAAKGTNEVARTGLAAFNATTGALITSFNPVLTPRSGDSAPQVFALTLAPDHSTLYVGGKFASIDGNARSSLAALSVTGTSESVTPFTVNLHGGYVDGITTTADGQTVYFGGGFSNVGNNQTRTNAAAATAAGAVLPWAPNITGTGSKTYDTGSAVRDLLVSPDGSEVVLGGSFGMVNGARHQGIMAVDPTTGGSIAAWGAGPTLSQYFQVYNLYGDANGIYVPGVDLGNRVHATEFDGTALLNWADGSTVWEDNCGGDTQAMLPVNGTVYVGGHAHDCSTVPGGFPPQTTKHHFLAERLSDGLILPWFPNTNAGPNPGDNGPRVLATDGTQLFSGGDFTAVNGKAQQGLTRFGTGPDTTKPTTPGTPRVYVRGPSQLDVRFTPSWDTDDGTLTYRVYRDKGTTPVATVTADTRFWSLPEQTVLDNNVPAGSHTYTVVASDGTTTSATSPASTAVDASTTPTTYSADIRRGGPTMYWRLDDASGATTAADSSDYTQPGTYHGTVTLGSTRGALAGDSDTAATFDGSTGYVASPSQPAPSAFSLDLWFDTTTTTGGKLAGFGNAANANSTKVDKQIYLTTAGKLVFGVNAGGTKAVTITTPGSYNDGRWHHVVATMGSAGMVLYVDGSSVGTNATTTAQTFNGYWRFGGDFPGAGTFWPNRPSNGFLAGSIDEAAVYPYTLSSQQVGEQYALGTGTQPPPPANQAPTASFASNCPTRTCAFDGSASYDPDGTVASYAWNFGDGSAVDTTSGAKPTHTYANAGTYTVTLTVTDNQGAQSPAASATVNPVAGPTTSAFTATCTAMTCSVDGSPSTADGGVSSYAWDFGDGGTTSGSSPTASHTYAVAGTYPVRLTVTGSTGGTASTTQAVTPRPPANAGYYASDTFARTVSKGWGTSDSGNAWSVPSSYASLYAVNGGAGTMSMTAGATDWAWLPDSTSTDSDVTVDVADDKAAAGGTGQYAYVLARRVANNTDYRLRLHFLTDGSLKLAVVKRTGSGTDTLLTSETAVGLPNNMPGALYRLRMQATGTNPTTIRGKAWPVGAAEPGWQLTATDSQSSLQTPAPVGLGSYLAAQATNAPVTMSYSNLAVHPSDQAPTAAFTSSCAALTCSFDASGSTDDNGVVSYAWSFGDTGTGSFQAASTSATTTHIYQAPGTYPVTLTVTDASGNTSVATGTVTVAGG